MALRPLRIPPGHVVVLWALLAATALPAATPPPKPANYFNDYAGMVSPQTRASLEKELADLDRATSSQVVVALFPALPPGAALEDFTRTTAEAWGVGRKQTNNGVVLFAFQKDRALRIEVGYGLEGALPDAIAKRIIEDEIIPKFRAGDVDGGITAGVRAILQAVRGEYTPRGGRPGAAGRRGSPLPGIFATAVLLIAFLALLAFTRRSRRRRGWIFDHMGHSDWRDWTGGWGGSGHGGGGFGGGSFGGGGFSGGGGSFGGGGASGRW